ncbi:MAG TPA: NAD(P)-dependent oxidoreductase [Pseudonocardia sp.]|nr:NAD(P)-dependent oxidoreductase [Pseudonocardia sp.]
MGTVKRVGFIGLGHMGAPMAANLLAAGFELVVHDTVRSAGAAHEAEGASWAASPREVGKRAELVVTMLPTPAVVESVLLGADGLLDGLAPGTTWLDMSTSTPEVAARVRALATPKGVAVLDAPVAGMAAGAQAGTLQIYVGGPSEDYERVLPALRAMGDPARILHVGPHGAGYVVKLMVNLLWFTQLVATAEVLTVGVRAGVDLAVLRDSLLASPARGNLLEHDMVPLLRDGNYDESFAMALACKDLGLAVDVARSGNVPVELSALVEQVFRRARASYGDLAGEMVPVRLYEDAAGIALRLPGPDLTSTGS